jgi:hypothetical protein
VKRSHKVYVLVALIGIAGVSLARYISSLRDVEAPKPAAKYADKKSEVQIESVTPPKAEPDQLVSEYKPQMRSEKAEQRESQPQEVSLRPTRPEDRRLRVEEPRRQLPPVKQEAEPPAKRQPEAFLPAEGFEKGKALDDEFEEETGTEKLQLAHELSTTALKKAAKAREMCDCEELQEGLALAKKAAVLILEVAAEAENTGNIELAQSAYNMTTKIVGAAVALIIEICTYCAQTSLDPETVACCEQSRAKAEEIAGLNNKTIDTTLAAGAIPELPEAYEEPETPTVEPPVEDELPIRDHEQPPASPV